MKKIILTIAAVISSVCFMSVNAQSSTSFGVKANGILTDVRMTKGQGANSSFKPGGSVGAFMKLDFNRNFALQPELLLSYSEGDIKMGDVKNKYKYGSVEIPVYAVAQVKAANGRFFLGAGPTIGYGLSIDSKTEKIADGAPGDNKLELDHFFAGVSAMAGYEFKMGLMINAGYKMGWDLGSNNIKTQTISLGVGYRF